MAVIPYPYCWGDQTQHQVWRQKSGRVKGLKKKKERQFERERVGTRGHRDCGGYESQAHQGPALFIGDQ